MIVIEIQQLISQLEDILNQGWRLPLTPRVLVDEEACRRVIDQMRVSVPGLIKQAERTLGERDRIIAQANEEAGRIVQIARQQATDLVDEHEVTSVAHRRANELIAAAEREQVAMRSEADEYALNVLRRLAEQVEHIEREVNNGIKTLTEPGAGSQSKAAKS